MSLGSQKAVISRVDSEVKTIKVHWEKEKIKLHKKIQREETLIQRNYEKYALGKMDSDDFMLRKVESNSKIQTVNHEISLMDEEKCDLEIKAKDIKQWLTSLYKAHETDKLSLELIHSLVKKVEVSPDKKVKITLKYKIDDLEGIFNE